MSIKSILAVMVVAFVGFYHDACALDLLVSPENDGLAVAIENARSFRREGKLPADETVRLLLTAGRYRLLEPIVLTPADSGLHFIGPEKGTAIIDGGVELPKFVVGANGVWETKVSDGLVFNQLWVGGIRAQRARIPNKGFLYMADSCEKYPMRAFYADLKDIAPVLALDPADRDRVLVGHWESWDMGYDQIESLDPKTGHIVMRKGTMRKLFNGSIGRPRYVIENLCAALDAPGEWFHDVKAGKLFYIPREGETPDTVRAVAPKANGLLVLRGDRAKNEIVRDITVRRIGFEHSAFASVLGDVAPHQSGINMGIAAIQADGAEKLCFERLRISRVGAYGVWMRNGVRDAVLRHLLVQDLGSGGVAIGDMVRDQENPDRNTGNIELSDSIVRRGGRYNNSACGVWVGHAHHVRVEHNDISDFFYTGISIGWLWGYKPTVNEGNRIAFNRIRDIAQGRQSDVAGIYVLGPNPGMQITGNWISDVNGYLYFGAPAWGLYADEGTSYVSFTSNLVERCRMGAMHHHYGKENVCANNIFATFEKSGFWRGGAENHVSQYVRGNIFWWTNPKAEAYNTQSEGIPADDNVYWCADGSADRIFNGRDLADWRKGGNDGNGVVADPQFYDAKRGDWRLKATSPALVRGFRPFDWTEAGVLKSDKAWRTKAAVRTADPFEDVKPPDAPAKILENISFDAEMVGVGVIRNQMDVLKPLCAVPGKPGTLSITDKDAAQGRKALVFTDVEGLEAPWAPHVFAHGMITGGTTVVEFAFKTGPGATMSFELRDGATVPGRQVTGLSCGCGNGNFTAGTKSVCKVPFGAWVRVRLEVTMSGLERGVWTCAVTLPDGETRSARHDTFNKDDFRRITWFGFMSFGAPQSEFQIDDFKVYKEDERKVRR